MSVIVKNPEILGGMPVFAGTRVPVKNLFDALIGGDSIPEFLDDFPTVTLEQVQAVVEDTEGISIDPAVCCGKPARGMKNQKSISSAIRCFLASILILNSQYCYSQSGDLNAWKTDFTQFKKAFEEGTPVSAKKTEEEPVSWKAKFSAAEVVPIPNGGFRYNVIFELPPIETKDGKLILEFICEEADFEEWKQVPKGSTVEFNALWLKMMMAFPNQPVSTLFSNTKLKKIVE